MLGLGMSISVAPLTTTVMNSVDVGFAGAASGINNAASRVAALLAVALFGLIMASIFNRSLHSQLERAELTPARDRGGGTAARQARRHRTAREHGCLATKHSARQAIAEAFVTGFRWIMLISAALALASAASAWCPDGKRARPQFARADRRKLIVVPGFTSCCAVRGASGTPCVGQASRAIRERTSRNFAMTVGLVRRKNVLISPSTSSVDTYALLGS